MFRFLPVIAILLIFSHCHSLKASQSLALKLRSPCLPMVKAVLENTVNFFRLRRVLRLGRVAGERDVFVCRKPNEEPFLFLIKKPIFFPILARCRTKRVNSQATPHIPEERESGREERREEGRLVPTPEGNAAAAEQLTLEHVHGWLDRRSHNRWETEEW